MSDPTPEAPGPATPDETDAGEGVLEPLRLWREPVGDEKCFVGRDRSVEIGPRDDGSLWLEVRAEFPESAIIYLTPADAIVIGRALAEMGEATLRAKG